jgi:amyloid beta precursor protein binding protein 1
MARKYDHELNFQEATQNAYLAYTEKTLDDHQFQELLQKSEACPKLKVLLVALQTFVKMHNRAPLHGTIPDMTASTDLYVGLQRLYHDQAASDVHDMKQILQTMQQPPNAVITDEDVTTFCKNVFSLDVLTTRTLEQEMTASTATTPDLIDEWNMALMDPYEVPEHTPFLWYMALRGCRVFYQQHGRYPGTTEEFAQDAGPLQMCMVQVAFEMKLHENELVQQTFLDVSCKYAQEMMRYGQAEIHNVASVVGGVASQEAVKMITGQYVPLNNTYIYNGIASTGGVYEF